MNMVKVEIMKEEESDENNVWEEQILMSEIKLKARIKLEY